MKNAHVLYEFVEESINEGRVRVCMDMTDCCSTDSTFMGLLLLINDKCKAASGAFHLINLSEYVQSKFIEVGLCEILELNKKASLPDCAFTAIGDIDSMSKRMNMILRAHKILVESNPQNEEKFGIFINALESDMDQKPAYETESNQKVEVHESRYFI